jgi:hypothetical protein
MATITVSTAATISETIGKPEVFRIGINLPDIGVPGKWRHALSAACGRPIKNCAFRRRE